MSKHYFTWEENEAYKEGKRDEERHRHNYDYDRYSNNDVDRAYFDGRKEQHQEELRREEEQEELRMEEERQERLREERMQEEYEYEMYLQSCEEQRLADIEALELLRQQVDQNLLELDEENLQPITEEELFMQIEEDERNETLSEFDRDIDKK